MYLGITGARIPPADAMYSGLATHFVKSEKLKDLEAAILANPDKAIATLDAFHQSPGPSGLEVLRKDIDLCFAADTPEEHVAALRSNPSPWAEKTLESLLRLSPHALRLSAKLIKDGANDNLRTCLNRELEISEAATHHPDFIEGVRAILVDKDRNPQWTSDPIA